MLRTACAAALAAAVALPAAAAKLPVVSSRPLALRFDVPRQMSETIPMFAVGGAALPIYLNRFETTYYGGYDDSASNYSSIVSGSSSTIGGFSGSDAEWNEVVTCVRDLFARFHVTVTDVEPVGGDYVEAMIGGSPEQLDMPWGVGGVAPYDPYGCQVIGNAVVYAFADVYMSDWGDWTRAVCETAAQEIAHAFALDHQLLASDPMTYLDYSGERSFKDEYVPCGEYEPRECSCSGANQNSVQMLYEQVGAADGTEPAPQPDDEEAPEVAIVSPADGATFEAGTTIEIVAEATDDVGIVLMELAWEYTGETMPCPGAGGAWSCERSGATYTWSISVGAGARTFSVAARDVGGNIVATEERAIWLSEDGAPMPDDAAEPEIAIVTPGAGAVLPANSTIDVVVAAADDSGVAKVELVWHHLDQVFPCPIESDTINCVVEGSTYTWSVMVGEGPRTISARVVDLVGNVVTTEQLSFMLDADAVIEPDDEYEGNDTWDFATGVQCGQTLDLMAVAGDDDWFRMNPPDGLQVRVTTTGDADLALDARTSPLSSSILAEGDGELVFTADGVDDVRVRVSPAGDGGPYRVVVTCEPVPLAGTGEGPSLVPSVAQCACAAADGTRPYAGVAVLVGCVALLRRRRR